MDIDRWIDGWIDGWIDMYGWMLLLLTTVLLCMYARYWLDGEYPREDREGRGRCYLCMHAYVLW